MSRRCAHLLVWWSSTARRPAVLFAAVVLLPSLAPSIVHHDAFLAFAPLLRMRACLACAAQRLCRVVACIDCAASGCTALPDTHRTLSLDVFVAV
jgi:hypothetical protein